MKLVKLVLLALMILILMGLGIFLCIFNAAAEIIVYTLIGLAIMYLFLGISLFLVGS